MKTLLTTALWLTLASPVASQPLSFAFVDYLTLPRTAGLHGISGIEYRPDTKEWHLAGDRGTYHIISQLNQLSELMCRPDSSVETGLYLEALRYDATTDTYYFAVENDEESYVGIRQHAMPHAGESFTRLPLPHAMPNPKTNKGIEGLALTANYLWVAPEAGSVEEATPQNSLIHLYRYKKTKGGVVLDGEFAYEIDRNVCPNENLGGISEIIAMPNDETRLLLLERCYQKPTVTARLYEAKIDEGNKKLIKFRDKPAFDFNTQPGFTPDNLEAMSWTKDAAGNDILVVVSDDNSGKRQWTQVILLQPTQPANR